MWHVTYDMWHMTFSVGWSLSRNVSSHALLVWDWQCLEDIWTKGSVNQSVSQLISDGGDCRTAPATPGLLITIKFWWSFPLSFSIIYYLLVFVITKLCEANLKPSLHAFLFYFLNMLPLIRYTIIYVCSCQLSNYLYCSRNQPP